MNEHRERRATRARLLAGVALLACLAAPGAGAAGQADEPRGSLAEIRERRRVFLLVSRTQTVDVRDPAHAAVTGYLRMLAGEPPRSHAGGHRAVARRLNKYINKYRSMSAVESPAEADFVVVFNVMRTRRSFIPEEPYVFGKLFVIARATGPGARPRVVWESEGFESRVDDAVDDFLKALKSLRGEK